MSRSKARSRHGKECPMNVIARIDWSRCHWKLAVAVAVAGLAMLLPAEAWAQLATDRIEQKFADIDTMLKVIAWGILGVGVIVIAVKLNNGDPDAKTRAWQFLFAALTIYMASDIINWLKA